MRDHSGVLGEGTRVTSREKRLTALRAIAEAYGANIDPPPTSGEWYSRLYGSWECELSDPEDFLEEFLKETRDV